MTYRDAYDKLIVQAIEIMDDNPDGDSNQYMREAIERMKKTRDNLSPVIANSEYIPIPM